MQRDPGRTWTPHSTTCHGPDPCFRARAVGQKPRQAERNSLVSDDASPLFLIRADALPLPPVGSCRGSEEECELAAHSKGGGRRSDSPSWVAPEMTAAHEVPDPKTSAAHPPERVRGCHRGSPEDARKRALKATQSPRRAIDPPATRSITTTPAITPIFMYMVNPAKLDHLQPRSLDFPARRVTGAPPCSNRDGSKTAGMYGLKVFFSRCSEPVRDTGGGRRARRLPQGPATMIATPHPPYQTSEYVALLKGETLRLTSDLDRLSHTGEALSVLPVSSVVP